MASDFIEHPRPRVIAGADCGLGGRVGDEEVARAKLDALVEGARIASEELWGGR